MKQQHAESLLDGIFHANLLNSGRRLSPNIKTYNAYLDKNESIFDVPNRIKNIVVNKLVSSSWQRYPPPYYNELEHLIATYSHTSPEQIVPGAGSANLITALLNYFSINNLQITIAAPSFSLYSYHCKTYGIKFDSWPLNNALEYDTSLLPELKPYSLVMFASPNNPIGNRIEKQQLINLLTKHPTSLFLVDEVYFEFQDDDFTELIDAYPNLLLLRSFSKTFSSAGLRIGYIIAHPKLAEHIKKLILPFSLNILAVEFVKQILSDEHALQELKANIQTTILERERVYSELFRIQTETSRFMVHPSSGNFLLVSFFEQKLIDMVFQNIENKGIKILNVSDGRLLPYALRLTIGKTEENNRVLGAFKEFNSKKKTSFYIAS